MTFSFSLVLGLFLLAPGFAVFAAIYHSEQLGPIRSPPPPPQSILALTIVTGGALAAHLFGACLFLIQDLYCTWFPWHWRVVYDPNVYATFFDLGLFKRSISGSQAAMLLGSLVALTAVSFATTRLVLRHPRLQAAMRGVLYGWLADVVADAADEAVLAYVLSDVEQDGTIIGYEGVVENMTTNVDREVTSLLLSGCETFYLRVSATGVARRKARQSAAIQQLYLERSRIKNVAFERVRFSEN